MYITKSKITKKLNSEENSKRKAQIHMAKSIDKTHQTNVQQLYDIFFPQNNDTYTFLIFVHVYSRGKIHSLY